MIKFLLILTLSVSIVFATATYISSSGDDNSPTETTSSTPAETKGAGEFFFRVRIPDHVIDAKTFLAEVRVYPATGKWPGIIVTDNGTIHETSVRTILEIADIDVPSTTIDYTISHKRTEKQETDFDKSIQQTRKLISAADTCIIANPVDIGGIIRGQVFIVIGGNKLDLGAALVFDGFAQSRRE